MEILDQMFAALENPPLPLGLEEEPGMLGHDSENLCKRGNMPTRQKTPRIPEAFPSDHESIQIPEPLDPIIIIRDIPITDDGDL